VSKKNTLLLLIPLVLSAYTHLWNATGFPDIFYDEGAYLRRALIVLYYLDPQESATYYDHPYFGQMILAAWFAITGFPDSLETSPTVQSIESIYLVPKILMGLLAIADTFLIYKIVQYRYKDPRVACFAALLFAVMPIGWFTRRVLLESLLLPLLLSSILLALQIKGTNRGRKLQFLLVTSGVCMGLAIFTKIPAFAAMPLIGYLICSQSREHKLRNLGSWLLPALLIPLLWPAHSIYEGQFDNWLNSVIMQTQRQSDGISTIFWNFWKVDPVLLILGIVGLGYSALVKRDFFPLLWAGPFLMLFSSQSYVQYFHVIPLLPVLCISSSLWLSDVIRRLPLPRVNLLEIGAIVSIGIFGLVITTLLITTNMTASQFGATAFVLQISNQDTTVIASPAYSWVYNFVLHMPYALTDYREVLYSPIPTNRIALISDPHFQANMHEGRPLEAVYDRTSVVQRFSGTVHRYDTNTYPYSSLALTAQGENVEVREYRPR
jgi:hypothetical protein